MILGFDVDGCIILTYDVDGGEGYDDLAEEAITLRNYDLNIAPLLQNMIRGKLSLLSHLYGVTEDTFKIYGAIKFDVIGELPTISTDVLISKLIEYVESQFDNDIENIIDVEPLKEMVNHDRSIDFRIDRVCGIGANVIETKE